MLLPILVLLFTLLPLAEIAVLLQVGEAIGGWETLGLVLFTGALGAVLARWQGLRVLRQINRELQAGALPTRALFDGALILVAAAVLVTPGVITDTIGFLLLIPWVRTLVAHLVRRWAAGRFQVHVQAGPQGPQGFGPGDVVDVDFRPVPPGEAAEAEDEASALPAPTRVVDADFEVKS